MSRVLSDKARAWAPKLAYRFLYMSSLNQLQVTLQDSDGDAQLVRNEDSIEVHCRQGITTVLYLNR